MASIYDKIETPKELISNVMAHGFSTKQEDISRACDIFGRAPIEDLVSLANDIGRNNEHGEPDPNGTWSSGRRETRSTFYMVLSNIWSWEDVTRFWNQHTNPEHEQYREMLTAVSALKKDLAHAEGEYKAEHEARLAETSARLEAEEKARKLEAELHDRGMTIMELKAKLYDLMTKEVN